MHLFSENNGPTECITCGQPVTHLAARVSIHGMYDIHLFHDIEGKTVDEVIDAWIAHNKLDARPAIVGDRHVDDLGPSDLCPAIVLSDKGKELRRVGRMVHWHNKKRQQQITEYREALLADPDIPALLRGYEAGLERAISLTEQPKRRKDDG